jgi:hypothetical protein
VNIRETATIIEKIYFLYPSFVKDESKLRSIIETWHEILKDYDFDRVSKNLITHSVNSDFLPKPKDLVKGLVVNEKYNIPNREETLKIIETYQVPEEKRATKEQKEEMKKKHLKHLGW